MEELRARYFLGHQYISSVDDVYGDFDIEDEPIYYNEPTGVYKATNRISMEKCAIKHTICSNEAEAAAAMAPSETRGSFVTADMVLHEIDMLSKCDHRVIVRLLRSYELQGPAGREFFLVMEYLPGGSLVQVLEQQLPHGYSEYIAANLFYRLLTAVEYLHDTLGIVHHDIKPDNVILMCRTTSRTMVKLTDFSHAEYLPESGELDCVYGTMQYCAPEILKGEPHNQKVDMWSLGVLLYALLTGWYPFGGSDDAQLLSNIVYTPFQWPATPAAFALSREARDLVTKLLEKDPRQRLSAKEALSHPWIENRSQNTTDRILQISPRLLQPNYEMDSARMQHLIATGGRPAAPAAKDDSIPGVAGTSGGTSATGYSATDTTPRTDRSGEGQSYNARTLSSVTGATSLSSLGPADPADNGGSDSSDEKEKKPHLRRNPSGDSADDGFDPYDDSSWRQE